MRITSLFPGLKAAATAMTLFATAAQESSHSFLGFGRAADTRNKRPPARYTDRVGMPHGGSGDKLTRKAMQGKIGLRHRGPYHAWHGVER